MRSFELIHLARHTAAGSGGRQGAIGLALRGVLDRVSLKARVIAAAILRSYTPDNSFSVAVRFVLWRETSEPIRPVYASLT